MQLWLGGVYTCTTLCCVQVSVDDSRVQELLLRMTGMDLDRVFLARKEPLTLPRYKLMDAEQLKEVIVLISFPLEQHCHVQWPPSISLHLRCMQRQFPWRGSSLRCLQFSLSVLLMGR